jgi:16S rRNA (cytosine967-C5)-methyltransferase
VQSRISKTIENIERCGFTNISCFVKDMTEYYPEYENAFDRVLIDAPCSGLGVAGKRPEIKLKYKSSDSLVKTQKELIRICSKYVKKSGILVYGTCTVNKEENQDIVEDFLTDNDEYYFDNDFFEQGFYAARLIRK